jgi:hypothetical protein
MLIKKRVYSKNATQNFRKSEIVTVPFKNTRKVNDKSLKFH